MMSKQTKRLPFYVLFLMLSDLGIMRFFVSLRNFERDDTITVVQVSYVAHGPLVFNYRYSLYPVHELLCNEWHHIK